MWQKAWTLGRPSARPPAPRRHAGCLHPFAGPAGPSSGPSSPPSSLSSSPAGLLVRAWPRGRWPRGAAETQTLCESRKTGREREGARARSAGERRRRGATPECVGGPVFLPADDSGGAAARRHGGSGRGGREETGEGGSQRGSRALLLVGSRRSRRPRRRVSVTGILESAVGWGPGCPSWTRWAARVCSVLCFSGPRQPSGKRTLSTRFALAPSPQPGLTRSVSRSREGQR